MKFEQNLNESLTPEWKSQYLCYGELKKILYKPKAYVSDPNYSLEEINLLKNEHFEPYELQFFQLITQELDKINNFTLEKIAEAKRKFSQWKFQLKNLIILKRKFDIENVNVLNPPEITLEGENKQISLSNESLSKQTESMTENDLLGNLEKPLKKKDLNKKLESLEVVISEFYLFLILLYNYQQSNHTGFRKILKKHDKVFQTSSGSDFFVKTINDSTFQKELETVQQLISETENIFISECYNGNRSDAMNRLRVPPLDQQDQKFNYPCFLFGLFLGLSAVVIALTIIRISNKGVVISQDIVTMFRGQLIISLYVLLFSFNLFVWRTNGVNHVLIFELDPRENMDYLKMLWVGMFLVSVDLALFCTYSFHGVIFSFNPSIYPFVALIIKISYLFFPLNFFYRSGRIWLLKIFGKNLLAGFFFVRFADFWLGDQMNSLNGSFVDIQFLMCYFIASFSSNVRICSQPKLFTKILVLGAPAYFRFAQCIKRYVSTKKRIHLLNAGKYSSSMVVIFLTYLFGLLYNSKATTDSQTVLNAMLYLFLCFARIFSTCYLIYWDLFIDWSLIVFSKNRVFLRENRIYKSDGLYISAIVYNVIVRIFWIVILINISYRFIPEVYLGFINQFLELIRRLNWNLYRLENEHLNNVGQYRAVRDISVKPIIKFSKPENKVK